MGLLRNYIKIISLSIGLYFDDFIIEWKSDIMTFRKILLHTRIFQVCMVLWKCISSLFFPFITEHTHYLINTPLEGLESRFCYQWTAVLCPLIKIIVCLHGVITDQATITLEQCFFVASASKVRWCAMCWLFAELNLAVSAGILVGEMRFLFTCLLHS